MSRLSRAGLLLIVATAVCLVRPVVARADDCSSQSDVTFTNCLMHQLSTACHSDDVRQCKTNNNNDNSVVDWKRLKAQNPKLYQNYMKRSEDESNICKSWRKAHLQNTARYRTNCVAQHAQPQLTEDIVREQFRRLPLPRGDLIFQPSWGALVNKKEIFYTRAERDHEYRMTLLGHQVVLHSHVQSYTWTWGDGSADSTFDVPGGPYPDFDVAHTYTEPATCAVSLALTYSATYTVDGGPLQQVQGTATVPGGPVDIRVVSAHAVLVQGDH